MPDDRIPPGLMAAACAIGTTLYLGLAALVRHLEVGKPSALPPERRLLVFALACFVGLGSVALSFPARRALAAGGRPRAAVLAGIGLSEVPAVLGLVFFLLSYDWTGFLLLLGAALIGFAAHTLGSLPAAG